MIADRIEGKWIDLFAEVVREVQGRPGRRLRGALRDASRAP